MAKRLIKRKPSPKALSKKAEAPKKPRASSRKLLDVAEELNKIKIQKKLLENRENELKDLLGSMLEETAYKDSKGSYVMKATLDGVEKVLKKEVRKRPKLNLDRAMAYLEKHPKVKEFVMDTKEFINESYMEQAVNQKILPMKDFESLVDMNPSYAIIIKDYKPEEEEEGII